MVAFSADDACRDLTKIIELAKQGERIIIYQGDAAVAEVVQFDPTIKRQPGAWKGKVRIPDSFYDPLPPEELDRWEGRA